jgi:hypothetical protein
VVTGEGDPLGGEETTTAEGAIDRIDQHGPVVRAR